MATALVMAVQAHASLYNITFTDGGLNTASGSVSTTDNGNGSETAVSGTLTVDPGGTLHSGTYSLLFNPNGTGYTVWYAPQGGGGFGYDNQIFPASNPFVNGNGLMFTMTDYSGVVGVNLWGNGANSYTEMGKPPWTLVNGNATLTAVPEPTTMIAGALLLLPFGASTLRMLRRRTA